MKVITLNFESPAHNLAADEALLNYHEEAGEGETLRFWESPIPFVVLGFSNKLSREVHEDVCRTRNIPILRRASGGGTVLQGPGCLNYTLILDMQREPELSNISSTTRYVLERNSEALNGALAAALAGGLAEMRAQRGSSEEAVLPPAWSQSRRGESREPFREHLVTMAGESDLVWNGLKFSGNAQRRLRRYVMFHGTFLYNFDLSLVECFLQMPEPQPEYRANRTHREFIGNIPLSAEQIVDAMTEVWGADGEMPDLSSDSVNRFVSERYSQEDWTRKF